MKSAKFLFYVINGVGIGHLTRLINIANKIRLIAPAYAIEPDIIFATTSDALEKLQALSYPAIKLPSGQGMSQSPMTYPEYRRMGFRVVTALIESLEPDMLVVDTMPSGKFDEFVPGLGFDAFAFCRRSTFICRPVRDEIAGLPQFQEAVAQYDLVLVPEQEGIASPPATARNLRYTGPIVSFDADELAPRAPARRKLGLRPASIAIYASTGGGGHADAPAFLEAICRSASSLENARIFLAPGPLFKGIPPTGPKIRLVSDFRPESFFPAMDMAVSAAGYNAFNELMGAGVPTVFTPLSAEVDNQHERAMRAVRAGAGQCLAQSELATRTAAVLSAWLPTAARQQAARNARALIPPNGARLAAQAILEQLLD